MIEVRDGIASVTWEETTALPQGDQRLVRLDFPNTHAPVLGEGQVGPPHAVLRRLYTAGQAAGNPGDLYEIRDREHSALPKSDFPQLTRVVYGDALKETGADYGAALQILFDALLIGNSSTALTGGELWRLQPRYMLTRVEGPHRLYQNYVAGQIHVYPEHRDHDPELGDLLPADTPYYLMSQGSSGLELVV